MPLIRNGTRHTARAAELTHLLAAELRNPKAARQPLIYDDQIGQVKRYNITVIWDEWANLEPVARSRIILDAYASAMPDRTGQITIAMGLTVADAASMGLLPFAVLPHASGRDAAVRARMTEVINAEPEVTKAAGGGPQLRFRTLEEATDTADRLRVAVPGSEWIVTQEVGFGRRELDD